MAIGHVACDPVGIAGQPDGPGHAEQAGEQCLDLGLAQARVAIGIEQHGLGGDQRALAVHVDGPTLVGQRHAETLQAEAIENPPRQAGVLRVGGLSTPGVETPADTGQPELRMADETRSGIAAPTVIDGQLDEFDIARAQLPALSSAAGSTTSFTGSKRAMALATAAKSCCTSARLTPHSDSQSIRLCGKAIQVAAWGVHSAGMRQPVSSVFMGRLPVSIFYLAE